MIRLDGLHQRLRAAEQLVRSDAFELLVIDLGGCLDLPLAAQTRLAGQALAHGTLILCLTAKTDRQPSLGSLVSVRAHAQRIRQGDGRFVCRVHVLKDKRRGPGWSDEVCAVDRMACVELPAFPLQLLLKRHPDWAGRPVAVVDRDKPQGVILWVNEQARAARIRTGMRYSAGLSLAHTLHGGEVPPADVERGVAAIAGRLHRFSPDVEPCRDEPGVFRLNASGLSYLQASLPRWAEEIVASLRACGLRAVVAVGFTRFGTCAVARTLTPGEPVVVIRDPASERELAERVRLSRLGIDPALRDSLHELGVRTVGAFLELPSEGIRRRFGPEAQRLHRFAAGDSWAPLQPLRVTEPLVVRHDLDDPETDAVRLLFHLKRLLDRLLATVAARHQALAELTLHLRLDRAGAHTERIRPAAPTLDIVQLMNLVRLRLESLALGAGVTEVRVGGRAVPATAVQQGLFVERPCRDRAAAERALARVRAEFGDEAVVRALLSEAHLPKRALPGSRSERCRPRSRGRWRAGRWCGASTSIRFR